MVEWEPDRSGYELHCGIDYEDKGLVRLLLAQLLEARALPGGDHGEVYKLQAADDEGSRKLRRFQHLHNLGYVRNVTFIQE